MTTPKISIIIPVYNVEEYLKECLDSAVNQSFKNIEIVCVNDCSTDSSLEILKEYAKKDSRIVVVDKEKNEGTMLARKSGIEVASGEYSVFLDADDYISKDLCQIISDESEKNSADIIHFPMGVIGSYSGINVSQFKSNMMPYETYLENDEIIKAAYVERRFASQLCGKAIRTDVCKKSVDYLPTERCHVGEDVFTFFITALFAGSYHGIITNELYFYRFGVGVSNLKSLSLTKFELFCKMSNWYRYASETLDKISANEIQRYAAEKMAERLFDDCSEMYDTRIRFEDKAKATDLMFTYWKDIPVDDSLWYKNTRYSKKYFETQYNIKEFEIISDKKTENPELSVVVIRDINSTDNGNIDFNNKFSDKIEYIYFNNGTETCIKDIDTLSDKNITIINRKYRGNMYPVSESLKYARGKHIYFTHAGSMINNDNLSKLLNNLSENYSELLCFTENNSEHKTISFEKLFDNIICDTDNKYGLSDYVINTEFLRKHIVSVDQSLQYYQMVLIPVLISFADRIKSIPYILCDKKQESFISKPCDAFSFINCFSAYASLVSKVISDTSMNKELLDIFNHLNIKNYNLSKNIYLNLPLSETRLVDKYLDDKYKPLFFDIRELRKTKMTLPYKIGNKFFKFLDK